MKDLTLPPTWAALTLWLGLIATILPLGGSAVAQTQKQIQIQMKFIEVTEDAAGELGFDWLIGTFRTERSGSLVAGEPGAGSLSGVRPIVDSSYDFQIETSTVTGDVLNSTGLVGIAGVFSNPQLELLLRALEQTKGADLMSAPSVVTRSGQRAKIEIIREFIYPTEFDPPEIPQEFIGPLEYFNPGETQFNLGVGGALGNLSETMMTTNTVRGVQQVEKTVTQQVQIGQTQGPNPNLARTQQQINRVQQQIAQTNDPILLNQLALQEIRLFRKANRQVQNQRDIPVFRDQKITVVENVPFEQEIKQQRIEGILDEDSGKLAAGFTHFFDNNFGLGGQFEWIQGNLDDAIMGQAEVTWRQPIEFDDFGIAPYVTGGIGGITGGGIDEIVGSVAGGVEFRLQNDVGIFTEYSHNFLGNGMDFGQILAGLNIVIGGKGIPKKPGPGGGQGAAPFRGARATEADFDTRNVGVTMEVTPKVGADGDTIELSLAPEVVEFEGFVNYGSPIQTSAIDAMGRPTQVVLTENRIEQPVFSTREVATGKGKIPILGDLPLVGGLFRSKKGGLTENPVQKPVFTTRKAEAQVTVENGQTAALGGLVREDVQVVEDKVPILGDIPLFGRLFRSRTEQHFKRNLVIFVTAEMIDPAGDP